MSARWNTNSEVMGGMTVHSTKEKADQAFALLEKLIQLGADLSYVGGTFDRTVTEFYKNEPVFEFLRQG